MIAELTNEPRQTTVDQHSFVLNGIPYIFTWRWVASEGRRSRRYLLAAHVYTPIPAGHHVTAGTFSLPSLLSLSIDRSFLPRPLATEAQTITEVL